ncbi:hypothetical protein TNCV_4287641 [Trichonephila clavipes]|uniref:Uncharacterized protein n=1 Tax=Trichonephila clavipes TaxID=2585209 RepID=A0A8X6SAJ0_TRICX|nr:hypothetical protein TNCV_4287641 [Trichonephila clavipes]
MVLIAVLYDLLWFTNVNEQNIKKEIDEVKTVEATEEPDETMDINLDNESKFEKIDEHGTFEMKGNFPNVT